MITRYHTQTGSIYEVDDVERTVRQVIRSDKCSSGRVGAGEWRPYQSAEVVHRCLQIVWGAGRDEYSANADQVGFPESGREVSDSSIARHTHTSPVVRTERVGEA
jgi:hypothetical protein